MRRWILITLAQFYFASSLAVAQQPNLNQVLNWLPADTETVLGANGPFAWDPKSPSNAPPSQERLTTAELEMQSRMFPLTLLNFKNGGAGNSSRAKPYRWRSRAHATSGRLAVSA
jgi:hypothetical protein